MELIVVHLIWISFHFNCAEERTYPWNKGEKLKKRGVGEESKDFDRSNFIQRSWSIKRFISEYFSSYFSNWDGIFNCMSSVILITVCTCIRNKYSLIWLALQLWFFFFLISFYNVFLMSHSRTKKFIPSLTRNLTWACHNTQRYRGCEFFGENSVRLDLLNWKSLVTVLVNGKE